MQEKSSKNVSNTKNEFSTDIFKKTLFVACQSIAEVNWVLSNLVE